MDLKRTKQLERAEELLIHLVDATEEMSRATGMGVAPWYYRQLAIIYHSQMDYTAEIAILERFAGQKHAVGSAPRQLLARLEEGHLAAGKRAPILKARGDAEEKVLEEFTAWCKGRQSEDRICAED